MHYQEKGICQDNRGGPGCLSDHMSMCQEATSTDVHYQEKGVCQDNRGGPGCLSDHMSIILSHTRSIGVSLANGFT